MVAEIVGDELTSTGGSSRQCACSTLDAPSTARDLLAGLYSTTRRRFSSYLLPEVKADEKIKTCRVLIQNDLKALITIGKREARGTKRVRFHVRRTIFALGRSFRACPTWRENQLIVERVEIRAGFPCKSVSSKKIGRKKQIAEES